VEAAPPPRRGCWKGQEGLAERQAAQREAAAAAESAYDLALQRFQAGLTGYLTVLATESDVLEARRAGVLLAARGCQLDVDLKRALGGGFEPPVTVAQHAQD
jgi:outer membrane protein TolC